jgi:plastocyanin
MIRRIAIVALLATALSGCGTSGGGGDRQVLVDYSPDDVAIFVAKDFPTKVTVKPGQTIAFKQTWTGEPHTVTGGASTITALRQANQWSQLFDGYTALAQRNHDMVNPDGPTDATFTEFATKLKAAKPTKDAQKVLAVWRSLRADFPRLPDIDNPPPTPFNDVNDLIDELSRSNDLLEATADQSTVNQNVAQPCYLRSGTPPQDASQACTAAEQRQPAFDGTQSFYNSGVLPYSGPRGNTFRMPIAKTTKPGTYLFYCAVHGPDQQVEVDVVKPNAKIPASSAVAREGRKEAQATVAPLVKTFRDARADGNINFRGHKLTGPFAGLPSDIHGSVNEFVPRTIAAKAGQPITWKVVGNHTISFDVPAYLPILTFTRQSIRYNPKVHGLAGGAPEVPPQDEQGGVQKFDAGTYDGTGFWSSGLMGADPYLEYTLRIAKPGTYPYACLVHPKMIGKIVVS